MLTNSSQAPPIITSGTKLACPSCTLHRPTSWAHVATLNSQQNKEWNSLQFALYWHRGVFGLACLQTQSQSSPDERIMARVATRSWTLLLSVQTQKPILLPRSNRSLWGRKLRNRRLMDTAVQGVLSPTRLLPCELLTEIFLHYHKAAQCWTLRG